MKHSSIATIRRTCTAWLLLAAAPIVGAQAQSPAPAASAPGAAAPGVPATAVLSNEQSSYLFGLTFGAQMHGVGVSDQVNMDALTRGMHDGLQGKKYTRLWPKRSEHRPNSSS